MWTASATGTPAEVRGQLSEQFKTILGDDKKAAPAPPVHAQEDDADEVAAEAASSSSAPAISGADADRGVAQGAFDLIETTLATISPERIVTVSVNADSGYAEKETKRAPFHNINLVITCR